MNVPCAEQIYELCNSVDIEGLPDQDRDLLKAQLEQLDRCMRLSVFGTDSRRVSRLVNFLLAQEVVPAEGQSGVPIQLQYAETDEVLVKLTDGETTSVRLSELSTVLGAARHITISAPLPALLKISIIQYANEDWQALRVAAENSASETDITFLCADGFDEQEDRFWMSLPQSARDSGYLVTPNDAQLSKRPSQILAGVVPLDVEAASALRQAPGALDHNAFKASGGKDLLLTLRQELKMKDQAIFDAVSIIVQRRAAFISAKPVHSDTAADTSESQPAEAFGATGDHAPQMDDAPIFSDGEVTCKAAAKNLETVEFEPEANLDIDSVSDAQDTAR